LVAKRRSPSAALLKSIGGTNKIVLSINAEVYNYISEKIARHFSQVNARLRLTLGRLERSALPAVGFESTGKSLNEGGCSCA
jgi:hypothetical protein